MISWTTQIADSAFTRLNQTFGSNGVLVHITCQSEAKKWFELLEASSTMFHWFLDQMRSYQSMYTPRHIYFLLCLKWACGATRKRLAGLTSTLIFSVFRTTVVLQKASVACNSSTLSYPQLSNFRMASALSHAVRLYIYNSAAWMHECKLLWSVHRCSQIWI